MKLKSLLPERWYLFTSSYETWYRLRLYRRFLSFIRSGKEVSVVDIGGGEAGLERLLGERDIVVADKNEKAIAEASKWVKEASEEDGSKLSFADNHFNWAVSFHTLEHIPRSLRSAFIYELVRVTTDGFVLNFPYGKHAADLCRNYLDVLKKNNLPPNRWTREHLDNGLPELVDILNIIDEQDKFVIDYVEVGNYNIENFRWRISVSRNIVLRIINKLILSFFSYLFRRLKPSVELVIVGSKSRKWNKEYLKRI